jgi:hypothetical protein
MGSNLATFYAQYVSYMSGMEIDPEEHKREIRKKGNIFKRIGLAMKAKKERKKEEKLQKKEISVKQKKGIVNKYEKNKKENKLSYEELEKEVNTEELL